MDEDVKMYWWKGADLARFFAEVNRRGSDNVRIELHMEDEKLYIRDAGSPIRRARGDDEGFNFIKTCPPDCPD